MCAKIKMILLLLVSANLLQLSEQAGSATLDAEAKFNVSWTTPGADGYITFTLTVENTGWTGFGWSPNGAMTNADIVTVELSSTGEGVITDRYTGDSTTLPSVDTDQDWTLHSHIAIDGMTTIRMSRKVTTCSAAAGEDIDITSDTTRLIWAYGTDGALDYHGTQNRGTKSVYLIGGSTAATPSDPVDAVTHDFLAINYTIPSDKTTYWCTLHAMPTVPGKRHVISFEPIVQEGNEAHVHHILIYGCYNGLDGTIYNTAGTFGGVCFGGIPADLLDCRSVIFGWAIGGQKNNFPIEAGFPFGVEGAPKWVVMETHYDNPAQLTGIQDSSGLRITYTSLLRNNDLDVMQLGSVWDMLVPPNRESTNVTFMCSTGCTSESFPDTGITAFAALLHSHLLGRAIGLLHTSTNGSSEVIASDNAYDFNYQEGRNFAQERTILPGDTLQVTCSMDSSSRAEATYGGLGTSQEMCLVYLYYYPQIDLSECGSVPAVGQGPAQASLYAQLGITDASSLSAVHPSVETNAKTVVWNTERGDIVAESYYSQPHLGFCIMKNRSHLANSESVVASSQFTREFLQSDATLGVCSGGVKADWPGFSLVISFLMTWMFLQL